MWYHIFGFYDKKSLSGFHFVASDAAFTKVGNKGDTSAANNNITLDFSFGPAQVSQSNV